MGIDGQGAEQARQQFAQSKSIFILPPSKQALRERLNGRGQDDIEVINNSSRVEYESTTSKVDDDQLFYCRSRGMDEEDDVALVVNGFCKEVLQALPMEFAMEAQALVAISLEGSVG